MDKLLGFKIPKIEQQLLNKYRAYYKNEEEKSRKRQYQGTQTWIGLHPQVLLTPYSEIFQFLNMLKAFSPQKVVDFGAGYGRVGIVMNSVMPDAQFLGYEILDRRIHEAERVFQKLGLHQCQMIKQNILDEGFEIPKADIYFIYDFSDPLDIKVLLKRLSDKLKEDRFFIVAKGEGIRSLIQLKFPEFWCSHGVIHKKNWSLYSSYYDLS